MAKVIEVDDTALGKKKKWPEIKDENSKQYFGE